MARDSARTAELDDDIEAIEIRLLLEALQAKHGYDLRGYSGAPMRRRIHVLLARLGLTRLSDLQHRVLREPELLGLVVDELTIRVSELFRDPSFYQAFREQVVPTLRTYPLLKIWHAGCAGGEEAYAMAILLTEEGLYDRAQIYATDVSSSALDQAKQGVYSADRLDGFAQNYRDAGGTSELTEYCTSAYGGLAFSEHVRRNILFFQHNLVSDHAFGEMNVVFCRNVFIYFSQELRAHVVNKFAQSLRPGGYLCLGQSERLSRSLCGVSFERTGGREAIYRFNTQL